MSGIRPELEGEEPRPDDVVLDDSSIAEPPASDLTDDELVRLVRDEQKKQRERERSN